ncbi:GDP-mannose 4,6-dehydratase [Pelagibacteraceae bacterium]|nr:GDP-mannose 4,6-dehydratase [Pelagibacteraceae bacterium]
MKKVALITGISGQDGSYLSELLLKKGYEVHGLVRRIALEFEEHRLWRLKKIKKDLNLHSATLENYASLVKIVAKIKPDEIYHLASQSFVANSFEDEFSTFNININGTHHILSAVKELNPEAKFYFAASSEMFGKVKNAPQNENTTFHPRSTYGISKVAGYHLARNYRESFNIFASSGILFNHESPRRGYEFVTRKISYGVAKIKNGLQKKLKLGNMDSKRDWGHAEDYVRAMWLMLQQKNPGDYVVGTGIENSVETFAKKAFEYAGLNYKDHIEVDKNLLRPSEVSSLLADYSLAKKKLKWEPTITFDNLVKEMVESDLEFVTNYKY